MSNTAAAMIAEARKHIGLGEPNYVQKWYRDRNGSDYSGNFAWCDAFVTYCSYKSGNYDVVNHNKDYAYTVYHAQRFQHEMEWFTGTDANVRKARPGDVVFFDWGGSNSVGAIDHVGIVEKNLGDGRVQTIEGNISDAVRRKIRESSVIAGFGRPKYKAAPAPAPTTGYKWSGKAPSGDPVLKKGVAVSNRVKDLQSALNKAMGSKLVVDGDFGDKTKTAVIALQAKYKLTRDGEYGPKSAAALTKALA